MRSEIVVSPRSRGNAGRLVSSALGWWVDRVRRLAWPVLAVALASAVGGAYYASTHLGISTDTDALLSRDLPYRKAETRLEAAFPQLGNVIAIVVDGATADQAEDAAAALAERLAARRALFRSVFYPAGDPFFRRNGMLYLSVAELHGVSDRLAEAEPFLATLARDMSLRGLFDVLGLAVDAVRTGETTPALLVRVFDRLAATLHAHLAGRPDRLSWRALMSATPPGPSDLRQIVVAQPDRDEGSLAPAEAAIGAVRQAAAALPPELAQGVTVRLTGGVPIAEDELASVRESIGLAGLISLTLVAFLVFVGLRSLMLVVGAFVSLLVGLSLTAAFAAVAIGHLNLISIAFAVLYIGLAVDFSIQFGLRYRELVDAGSAHDAALRRAAAASGGAIVLAAICAMIGFLAFVPTSYIGLSELGIIAAAGMAIGVACTLTVLPAILSLSPPKPRAAGIGTRVGGRLSQGVVRHAGPVCLAALALGLGCLAALPAARFDFDPINLRDPNTESVATYRDISRASETSPYTIDVLAPSAQAAGALARRLEALPLVDHTVAALDLVPKDQDRKLDIIDGMSLFLGPALSPRGAKPAPSAAEQRTAIAAFVTKSEALLASGRAGVLADPARRLAGALARLLARAGEDAAAYASVEASLLANLPGRLDSLRAAMAAEPVTLADVPDGLLRRYVAADGQARIEVHPAESLTDHAALRRFVDQVRTVAPDATGTPVNLLGGGDAVTEAFWQAGILALAAISVLLVVVLRSVADAILVMAPLALALAVTIAVMVMTGMVFNFANIIALPLLVSLGVAFGIYLVLRAREVGSIAELMRTSTPRAVLFSALTTMASFGSLMISDHRGTASMGQLLTLCLALAVASTLIVLAALLAWRQQRAGASPSP